MRPKTLCGGLLLLLFVSATSADDFDAFLRPLVAKNCVKCHGEEEVNAEINLKQITTAKQFLDKPQIIKEMIDVIDARDMPPESEPQLDEKTRTRLLATLKTMLRQAAATQVAQRAPVRRLNRFQYNNTVKDLLQLKPDVFMLPEKLMTRQDNYLHAESGQMPDQVRVVSHSFNPKPGLREVKAFPKDLRASHGFDNQANQLTLSPLLLDAFLRLSVSIVESPDFNEQNVGIWSTFFKTPADGVDQRAEIRRRLAPFLKLAFRAPVDAETLDRYTAYAAAKIDQGLSFTDGMKKVASAALSSPMFLYRAASADDRDRDYELASNLSYFLWSSCPDAELLRLAASGELSQPDVLNRTVDRMLADPKVERFLDTFPSQWMQLENILAATPDPQKHRLFSLDKNNPASLQMVLEPLLLFDTVFVEDRPIAELIAPKFAYQSDFLKAWYTTDLKPPPVDVDKIVEENRRNDERRKSFDARINTTQKELDALLGGVREKLLEARKKDPEAQKPIDLKPYAAWEFNGDLKESLNGLDLNRHGKIEFKDGMVVLNRSYLLSKNFPIDLRAKSLEIWCKLPKLDMRGGGAMGIQGPGDFFDTIVIGERKNRHWISGSNGFSRTLDFPESFEETKVNEMVHLVMVYTEDGTTTLYRDGKPYGKPYRKGAATFPKDRSSVIFGLRHLPAGGNKYLNLSIDKARLYTRALTADEVAASAAGNSFYVSDKEVLAALTPDQRTKRDALAKSLEQLKADRNQLPPTRDPARAQQDAQKWFDEDLRTKMRSQVFERVAAGDPRYGGVITNAAMLSMTSGPKRTTPIARGAWIIEVIFNDPPPPPPNDVPPLNEDAGERDLTIREKFAVHRENKTCAGCHSKLDPLGFALENFDITGRWRDKYENGRDVDSSGTLLRKYDFSNVVKFKEALVKEDKRFAKAFTAHLLRFATARELSPSDALTVDVIIEATAEEEFKLKSLIREVIRSDSFFQQN